MPSLSRSARPLFPATPSVGPTSTSEPRMGGATVSPPDRAVNRQALRATIHTRCRKFRRPSWTQITSKSHRRTQTITAVTGHAWEANAPNPSMPSLSRSARPLFPATPSVGPTSTSEPRMGGATVSPPDRAVNRQALRATIHTRCRKFCTEFRSAQMVGVIMPARFTRTFLVAGVSVLTPMATGVLRTGGLGALMWIVQLVLRLNGLPLILSHRANQTRPNNTRCWQGRVSVREQR